MRLRRKNILSGKISGQKNVPPPTTRLGELCLDGKKELYPKKVSLLFDWKKRKAGGLLRGERYIQRNRFDT